MSRRESLDSYNNSMLATPPTLHTSEGEPLNCIILYVKTKIGTCRIQL